MITHILFTGIPSNNLKSRLVIITIVVVGIALSSFAIFQNQVQPVFTIGIIQWGNDVDYEANIDGFKKGLEKFGFVENKNVKYILKTAHTEEEEERKIIQEFIDRKVDLIYTLTTPGTIIAKELTKEIPIVFSIVTYPVEAGIIKSLDSSENNLVGTTNFVDIDRQFILFKNIFPFKKIGFVHRNGEINSAIQFDEARRYLEQRGVEIIEIAPSELHEVKTNALNVIHFVDSLYIACDTLMQTGGAEIVIKIAYEYKKPIFSCIKEGVFLGALAGNLADVSSIGMKSGEKAALILQGVKPEDLYSEHYEDEFIIINQKAAMVLDIRIPEEILVAADVIIYE